MYGHILYIIIYWCLRDCYLDFFVSFFGSCFLKVRNALGNEKTAKLVVVPNYALRSTLYV